MDMDSLACNLSKITMIDLAVFKRSFYLFLKNLAKRVYIYPW